MSWATRLPSFGAAVETFADKVSIGNPAKTIRQNAVTLQRDGRFPYMLDSAPALLKKVQSLGVRFLARLTAGNISLHRSSHAPNRFKVILRM